MEQVIDQILKEKLKELGTLWRQSAHNPRNRILDSTLDSWEQLIMEWANSSNLPLIVRRGSTRGQEFVHPSGRRIIISDNTFALWVYQHVWKNETFELSDIATMLHNHKIPIVYALTREQQKIAKHTKTLGEYALSDENGKWKLCHIIPVGFNSRKRIEEFPIEKIKEHFIHYANPRNMFVLPKEIGGLGEVQEFIDQQETEDICPGPTHSDQPCTD